MYHASYSVAHTVATFAYLAFHYSNQSIRILLKAILYVGILLRLSSKSMPKYRLKGTRVTIKLAPFCRPLLPTEIHQTLVLGCAIR